MQVKFVSFRLVVALTDHKMRLQGEFEAKRIETKKIVESQNQKKALEKYL